MKQKIKIMKNRQQPSDEEIQQYMNFDRLLDQRKVAANASRTTAILKWGVPIVLAIVGTIGYFLVKNTFTSVNPDITEEEIPKHLKSVAPISPVDTLGEIDLSKETINKRPLSTDGVESEKLGEKSTAKQKSDPAIKESGYLQAEPVNGYSELYNYFNANLVYPAEGLIDSIQGVQTVSFVINVDGNPENIEVVRSLGQPFEKESRRLLENMPAWKPATLNGKPVASKISIPLTFQIEKIKN